MQTQQTTHQYGQKQDINGKNNPSSDQEEEEEEIRQGIHSIFNDSMRVPPALCSLPAYL